MSKNEFSDMSNINNLYSIGHNGNLNNDESSSGGFSQNIFGNMFELNEDMVQFIQQLTTRSNTLRILVPTLDQIFETLQSSPFSGLESLGLASYFDPGKIVAGYSLPKPLSLPSNKNQPRGK